MKSSDFKDFWDNQVTPVHAHDSAAWYDRYAEEVLFYLKDCKVIADSGCGSGEILERILPYFEKIYALDYSSSMIEKAEEKITIKDQKKVEFFCNNMNDIDKLGFTSLDAIYNNGVIQYLSNEELNNFVISSRRVLKESGKLILLNIPNINSRMLFLLGFYKLEKEVTFFSVLKGFFHLSFKMLIFKMKNRFIRFDDGIGNWYSVAQLQSIGTDHGFKVSIYGSSTINYYYRFHAVLQKV